ncbi:MAG TPA: alpha/beta hydrolase [Bdellovibrionales bacterium]|jgi:pimeloyl-ACP methyl ester carboxylesterase|nr:alpha/beta hydrolase [Bdellovibrionales bacterium]
MKSKFLLAVLFAITALTSTTTSAASEPTIILVHGAFADGSCWNKLIPILQKKKMRVIAVQNSLRSIADDAASLNRVIDNQPGPVILVGHSFGGAIITEAGTNPKVKALVYIAAFAPDTGESPGELAARFPTPPGNSSFIPDSQGFLYLSVDGMRENFAQDLPKSMTRLMAVTQGPVSSAVIPEKITEAAWRAKPSWYIVATEDRMISPLQQAHSARTMKADTIYLKSSHVPMISQPREIASVVNSAYQEVQ